MTETLARRRSAREKKVAKPFQSIDSALNKRKRNEDGEEEDEVHNSTDDDDDGDDDDDEDHIESRTSHKSQGQKKTMAQDGSPTTKKARGTPRKGDKRVKGVASKTRAKKQKQNVGEPDADKVGKETKVHTDIPLFNTLLNPAAALQSTVEDFLDSLRSNPQLSLSELINTVLRSCGCNESVDQDQVVDYDAIVDTLDDFSEVIKAGNSPVYPLTSKLPEFKKFRRSLSEFLDRLIQSAAELGSLYDSSDLMLTFQAWVIAMSSSQIRSFRHTATVIALEVETVLADIAAKIDKEAEMVTRQREGEKKRAGANNGKKVTNGKTHEYDTKLSDIKSRKNQVEEFLKDFIDGVFIHRYRDYDPTIRAECVRCLGQWFKKYPAHFLDTSYLRYIGWVLSDAHTPVRLEAVKSLNIIYDPQNETYISGLTLFTERCKPRLIDMAKKDTELGIRVAVLHVLERMDRHDLIEDEEREALCALIFDAEARVRKAIAGFVSGVWRDHMNQLDQDKLSENEKERYGIKVLATLLIKWSLVGLEPTNAETSVEADDTAFYLANSFNPDPLAQRDRTSLVVEALWGDLETVKNWQLLLDTLLMDHSAQLGPPRKGKTSAGRKADENAVDVWRLEENEESLVLEILIACLRKSSVKSGDASRKDVDDNMSNDIARAMIQGLPQLFLKYQTDPRRISELMCVPMLINLDLYLEMRMVAAYESLWDDITKKFLSHTTPSVLQYAVQAINRMMETTSLSTTNAAKIMSLEESLATALRDSVAEREGIEISSFTNDEIMTLEAVCARVSALSSFRDITAWMDEDEGGKQSCAWDIISAIADRGKLGYREERQVVQHAVHILTMYIIWKSKRLASLDSMGNNADVQEDHLISQRNSVIVRLIDYAVGTGNNIAAEVKRTAFEDLLLLHMLFGERLVAANTSLARLSLKLSDEVQYRCAGFVQHEIGKSADSLGLTLAMSSKQDVEDDDESDTEENVTTEPDAQNVKAISPRTIEEQRFISLVSHFVNAINTGCVDLQHGRILLSHYGYLGPSYDAVCREYIKMLRSETLQNKNGEVLVAAVIDCIQESFNLALNGSRKGPFKTLQLAKQLASCYILRGAHLSVVQKIESRHIVEIQSQLVAWICKRIATFQASKNQKGLRVTVDFFQVLIALIGFVDGRDAMTIKANMDQAIAQNKVVIPSAAKQWDSQRLYEKKLTGIVGKDKDITLKKQRKGKKAASADEESEAEIDDMMKQPFSMQNTAENPVHTFNGVLDHDLLRSPSKTKSGAHKVKKKPTRNAPSPSKRSTASSSPRKKRSHLESDSASGDDVGSDHNEEDLVEPLESTEIKTISIRRKRARH